MSEATLLTPDAGASSRPGAVRRIDPLAEGARWDADLAECPGASFFHSSAWNRVLREAYGFRPAYFTARASGRLHAVLPLMEVKSWLTGKRGVGLPFTDECAPLGEAESLQRMHAAALAHARARGWRYLEFRGGRPRFAGAPASASFYGHRLDLRTGEAALFARFDPSVRRAIRKAEHSGLTIEFSQGIEAARDFHALLLKTRKRHGVPPQPFHFFASIQRHVLARNQGWIVLARQGSVPVAGAVYFRFGGTVIYKYGASDEAFQALRANNLVMWEAIKRHAAEGFATLDFGRTALDNEGLRRFKLGWGATEHRVEYVRQNVRSGAFAPAPEASRGWTARIFKALPERVLQLIGAGLYKHAA